MLPAITWVFQFFLISRTVSRTFAVPVRGIDDDDIHVGLDQRLDALKSFTPVAAPTRSRPRGLCRRRGY